MKPDSVRGLPSGHGIDLELGGDTDTKLGRRVCSFHQERELQPPLQSTNRQKFYV